MLDLREPSGEHGRQERAHVIDRLDGGPIGEPAKDRGTESGHTEGGSESATIVKKF